MNNLIQKLSSERYEYFRIVELDNSKTILQVKDKKFTYIFKYELMETMNKAISRQINYTRLKDIRDLFPL